MKVYDILSEDGRIVKGVNTTPDVGPGEIKTQAAKFGNTVDRDGHPPTLSKRVKGKSTNVLYNLGLAESKKFIEALGEIANATEIYVDMDGVLADFFGDWAKLMGVDDFRDIAKQHNVEDALQKIRDTENFWLDLPLTSNAKNLLGLIKKVKGSYKILSSPLPGDPNSEPHKREWIEKHLGFFPPKDVIITHDKAKYATQEDGTPNILIDDYGVNINKWEAAGGYGFKHKDHKFERTAKNIEKHMKEPVAEVAPVAAAAALIMRLATLAEKIFKGEKFLRVSQPLQREAKYLQTLKDKFAGGKNINLNRQQSKEIAERTNEIRTSTTKIEKLRAEERVGEKISQKELNAAIAKKNAAHRRIIEIIEDAAKIVEENFADGKKKGKSRPGRVKKAGASCKGSVTSLRKKAAKYSGEKGKMYHWCANMKGGKKK